MLFISMVSPALPRFLIAIVLAIIVAIFMAQNRRMMTKVCVVLFLFAFIGSFSIYTLGYLSSSAGFADTLWAAMRGIFSAARMFFVNDDYGYLVDTPEAQFLLDNVWVQIIFWFCHVLAVFLTASALISVLGRKLTENIRIWFHAHLPLGKNKCHYVVIGSGKYAKVFLDDLQKTVSKENITIISGEADNDNSAGNYEELVDKGFSVIKGKAGLNELKKVGTNNLKRNTKVIALTENDEQNLEIANIIVKKIHAAILLAIKDEEKVECLQRINLEAYIMCSFIEKTDHFAFAENACGKVRFFSPYELRARGFFYQNPITSFVPHLIDTGKARLKGTLNADGKVVKQDGSEYLIKSVFIGFGAANYQMLKNSILTGQLLGCDYNAIIYDKNISADVNNEKPSWRQAMFVNNSSGLFPSGDEKMAGEKYLESPKEKYNIIFKNGDVLAKNFYSNTDHGLISEVVNNDFTAIYIALGEDKLNVETACEIRQCLYEHGVVSSNKVKIFVKIAENSVFDDEAVVNNSQNIINYDKSDALKIKCFGSNSSILTKDNIVNETLDGFARVVTNRSHGTPWELLPKTKQDINRQVAMAINIKLNLLGFQLLYKGDGQVVDEALYYERYVQSNNETLANIIALAKEIAVCEDKKNLKTLNEKRSSYILDYMEKEPVDGIILDTPRNNLARLEHLRWDTFYYVNGWTKLPMSKIDADNSGRQNKYTKQHACLTTFEGLIQLRKMQAEKEVGKNSAVSFKKAEINADTIWYDYDLMDEIICRMPLIADYKIVTLN